MQIQISWLLQKPTDLDLHCLQRQGVCGFSRTRVNITPDKALFHQNVLIFFLFLQENMLWSLIGKVLRHFQWVPTTYFPGEIRKIFIFSWRNKKNIHLIPPKLELCMYHSQRHNKHNNALDIFFLYKLQHNPALNNNKCPIFEKRVVICKKQRYRSTMYLCSLIRSRSDCMDLRVGLGLFSAYVMRILLSWCYLNAFYLHNTMRKA